MLPVRLGPALWLSVVNGVRHIMCSWKVELGRGVEGHVEWVSPVTGNTHRIALASSNRTQRTQQRSTKNGGSIDETHTHTHTAGPTTRQCLTINIHFMSTLQSTTGYNVSLLLCTGFGFGMACGETSAAYSYTYIPFARASAARYKNENCHIIVVW